MNTALNKKFFSYVIPSILAFALSGVYTIVDGFFIGQSLGDTGLTAITLSYPISALIGAVGTGLGLSGAIRFTILNAQGETQKRQECFSGTTLLMLLTAGLLTAILFAFAQPILHLLGARGNMLTLCVMYAQVIALGAVFQLFGNRLRPIYPQYGRGNGCHDSHGFRLCNEYCFGLCFRVGPELGNGRRCMGDHYRTGRDYDRGSHFLPCKK